MYFCSTSRPCISDDGDFAERTHAPRTGSLVWVPEAGESGILAVPGAWFVLGQWVLALRDSGGEGGDCKITFCSLAYGFWLTECFKLPTN